MKSLGFLAVLAATLLPAAYAQDPVPASVTWTLVEASGLAVSSTEGAAAGVAVRANQLTVRDYIGALTTGDGGPLGPFQRWWLGGDVWPDESAPNPDRFIEFAVAAGDGATFDVTALSLVLNAGGTSALRARLAYDTDPAFANPTTLAAEVNVARDAVGRLDYPVTASLAGTDSLYVRIYPWVRSSTTGSGRYVFLQDVSISGTSTGTLPPPPPPPPPLVPDFARWTLTAADTLAATTEGEISAISVRASQLTVRDYIGALTTGDGGPLGPFQRWWLDGQTWPDESAPNPDRFVEFVVAPATPTSQPLAITDIALVLNAGGTGALRASLFYDTDPAFSNPTPLATEINVSRDALGEFSYTLDQPLSGTDSLYVRIYPWVRSSTTGSGRYLFLQNMTIGGTASTGPPPPEQEGAYWSLTSDTDATFTIGEVTALPVRSSALVIRDYIGTLSTGAGGPLGLFQRWWLGGDVWPDESAPNTDRYLEFVVARSADADMDFVATDLSLVLNAGGTSAMRASLVYSTDPAFSSPNTLETELMVLRDAVGRLTYSFEERIAGTDSLYFRIYPWVRSSTTGPGRNLLLQDVSITGRMEAPVSAEAATDGRLGLLLVAPNPARGSATVRYALDEAARVSVEVFNALGQRVLVLADGARAAGAHETTVDASTLSAGVYIVRLRAGDAVQTRRLTVLR